jgi:hypothetical protein
MKFKFILFIIAIFVGSNSAEARTCYSAQEFEAEQGLRIHSELMVIALNCQQMHHSTGDLYYQYKDFTRRHAALISGYENTLKRFYSNAGYGSPEKEINDLRTDIANRISNDAARMKPNVFCKAYGSRITQALRMDQDKLRRWAATPFPGHPATKPVCAAG